MADETDGDWDDFECPDHCADKVPLGKYYYCHVCGAEWLPDEDEDTPDKEV